MEDRPSHRGVRLGTPPVRRGYIGGVDVSNAGICTDTAGKNCGVYSDIPDL